MTSLAEIQAESWERSSRSLHLEQGLMKQEEEGKREQGRLSDMCVHRSVLLTWGHFPAGVKNSRWETEWRLRPGVRIKEKRAKERGGVEKEEVGCGKVG